MSNDPAGEAGAGMLASERRAAFSLAGIFALRMLGLFMILPVFSLHAAQYSGHTPMLIGLAIGIYGLTQALFQIPFGMLSDRLGRKKVITAGLLIFALGCVVAALADSMWGVIAGRALQGLGAVGAVVIALTADLTREEQRTKAMAIIGVSIGLSFAVALVLGPAITGLFGMSGLFWLTAILSVLAIAVLHYVVPQPAETRFHRDAEPVPAQFARVVADTQLLRLDFGILILHFIMTASFVAMPLALRDQAGISEADHWLIYLCVLAVSVVLMAPFVRYADRRNQLKPVFLGAVLALGLTELALSQFHASVVSILVLLTAYFTAFNILEATLPSLVSRIAPPEMKGTALGAYSSAQYFGAFLGGVGGGWMYGRYGLSGVFLACAGLALVWLAFAATMANPRPLSTHLVKLATVSEHSAARLSEQLLAIDGVEEAVVNVGDGVAYLKVNRRTLDREALRAFSAVTA